MALRPMTPDEIALYRPKKSSVLPSALPVGALSAPNGAPSLEVAGEVDSGTSRTYHLKLGGQPYAVVVRLDQLYEMSAADVAAYVAVRATHWHPQVTPSALQAFLAQYAQGALMIDTDTYEVVDQRNWAQKWLDGEPH